MQQGAPYTHLKCCRSHKYAQRGPRPGGNPEDSAGKSHGGSIVLGKTCVRPIFPELFQCCIFIIEMNKRQMADPAWTFADHAFAKGSISNAKNNGPATAALLQLTGRGTFQTHTKIMKASGAREAALQSGSHNTFTFFEQLLRVRQREALEKIFGGNARPGRKQAMKMERTQSRMLCKSCQPWLFRVMLIQIANNVSNAVVIVHKLILTFWT